MTFDTKKINLIFLFITLPLCIFAIDQNIPRLKLLHPQQNMQFRVSPIEIAGDIPPGTEVSIAGTVVRPDDKGRFRYMLSLDRDTVLIPIIETRGARIFYDTLRVFHGNPDRMLEDSTFINHNIPNDLAIHFVFPKAGIFKGASVGLRGRTHPDAILTMNGEPVRVYPSGAYTIHVPIIPGENHFIFTAVLNGESTTERLTLIRPQIAGDPVGLDRETALPKKERWIMAGERLQLGIQGSPDKTVFYKIPGLTGWQKLAENKPGHYTAQLYLSNIDHEIETHVLYRVGFFSRKLRSAPLRILIDTIGGITNHLDTRVYDAASTDQLLFPLTDSISLQIIGLENQMYHIQLGRFRTAFVRADRVKLDPKSKLTSAHFLGPMRGENEGEWTVFRIFTGETRLPFEIKEKAVPSRLELKIYGAKQGWEWTTYPDDDSVIRYVERSQPDGLTWQMNFYPDQNFWGWFGRYEGQYLVIGIRKAPSISIDSLFTGIRFEIDPGHGGWERGALGVTGYAEADANLRYCQMLKKMLLDAGATVFMTRQDDRQVSLVQRAEKARHDSIHIFIMSHNNAPGLSTDLLTAKGASTFYTWPSSKALSDNIYPYLGRMGIDTSGKVNRYYYYLTRQTEYLVYLIEGAFMTYPPEEMFLMSEEGLEKLAKAAFLGLQDFLLEQAIVQE